MILIVCNGSESSKHLIMDVSDDTAAYCSIQQRERSQLTFRNFVAYFKWNSKRCTF